MGASRYVLGCAAVAAFSTVVGLGTVVIVQGAVSGGSVQSLSQADVAAQLSAAAADESHDPQGSPHPSASPSPRGPVEAPERPRRHQPDRDRVGRRRPSNRHPRAPSSRRPQPDRDIAALRAGAHAASSSSHPQHVCGPSRRPSRAHPDADPDAHPTPTPTDTSVTKVLSSVGGSVVARCSAPELRQPRSISSRGAPRRATRSTRCKRGPAPEVEITFTTKGKQVNVSIQCSSSGPVEHVEIESGDG